MSGATPINIQKLIDACSEAVRRVDAIEAKLERSYCGFDVDSGLVQDIYNLVDNLVTECANILGVDAELLNWFFYENEHGNCGYKYKRRKITSSKDLADYIKEITNVRNDSKCK
jgi:hypothetical protein